MSFPAPVAPTLLILGFVFLPMFVVSLALLGLAVGARRQALPRWMYWVCALLLVAAMGVTLGLAVDGSLANFRRFPPPLLPVTGLCILLWVAIATSRAGRALDALPLAAVVGFHAFRLPLELMMHAAADAGVMPRQMSYSGWNFDIVTGASAAIVSVLAALGKAPRPLLLAWNALGSVLLFVVVAVAISSGPPLLAFGSAPEQANTWVAYAPFVWLPTVLVPAAVAGHVVLWRRLLAPGEEPRPG
jgi:hypothetical protein